MALASRARSAFATAALAAVTLVGATACQQPETIRTYTPANGANAEIGTTKARGLALVTSGGPALLTGAIVSEAGEQLLGVEGASLAANGDVAGELTAGTAAVALPANQLVTLQDKGLLLDGKGLKPGLTARVTLKFSKAGAMVVTVPVVSTDHPDWATMTPKPGDVAKAAAASASPSATPSASASASPAASSAAGTPAPTDTPSASPSR